MLSRIAMAGVMLASLTLPGVAATGHQARTAGNDWFVLQDAGGTACYVANRMPGPDETRKSQGFGSEQQAQLALGSIASCESVNIDHDKDSSQSNS